MLFHEPLPTPYTLRKPPALSAQEIAELLAEFLLSYPPALPDATSGEHIDQVYEKLLEKAWEMEGMATAVVTSA